MYIRIFKDYELSSLCREIKTEIESLTKPSSTSSTPTRWEIDSMVRDLKSAQSGLDRAIDDKVKEVQRNAGKSGSSYGYSSADSGIRDAKSKIERGASKIAETLHKLTDSRPQYGSDTKVQNVMLKIKSVTEGYAELLKKCELLEKERASFDRKYRELEDKLRSKEQKLNEAERLRRECEKKNRSQEQTLRDQEKGWREQEKKLRAEIADAREKLATAGLFAAAAAPIASVNADARVSAIRRACEQRIAELKESYDQEIRALRQELDTKIMADASSGSPGERDASDYARLWNEILEDDIIEISEVQEIKDWLSEHPRVAPEFASFYTLCESILSKGEVSPDDAQALYDCSFALLKIMGAHLG